MHDSGTDRELLREYLRTGAEASFRELVVRHARMVRGTAIRVTGNPDSGDEIAQLVFIAIAKKAHWLAGHESLAGWLHRSTVLEARLWSRGEQRRRLREQQAYEQASVMQHSPALSTEQLGLLDEALLGLDDDDRQLVVLRHCEGHSYPDIARQLGLREDAVRKRCDKAMTQVVAFFRKKGMAVGGVAVIAAGLDSTALAVSSTFVTTVTKTAMNAAPAAFLSVIPILIGKFMALSKAQAIVTLLALAALPVAYGTGRMQSARNDQAFAATQLADMEKAQAATQRDLKIARLRFAQAQRRNQTVLALMSQPRATETGSAGWVDGLQYTRVPKSAIAALEPLKLDANWRTTTPLRQLLGLNQAEDEKITAALDAFTAEISRQNEAHLRRVPVTPGADGEVAEERIAFVVDERVEESRQAARKLETDIWEILGRERGRIALKHFALPQLPDGTTDYQKYQYSDTVNNILDPATTASQGLEWRVTFHRTRMADGTLGTFARSGVVSRSGISQMNYEHGFNHPATPPSLRAAWAQWKAGAAFPAP